MILKYIFTIILKKGIYFIMINKSIWPVHGTLTSMYLLMSSFTDRMWHKVNLKKCEGGLNSVFFLQDLPRLKNSLLLTIYP